MYIELLENIFWMEFGLTGVISGIMGGYMKLYDKNNKSCYSILTKY